MYIDIMLQYAMKVNDLHDKFHVSLPWVLNMYGGLF